MTKFGWRDAVKTAIWKSDVLGDNRLLDMLCELLEAQDTAKDTLGKLGYGCTGAPWAQVVEEVRRLGDRS
jgi:hypothetical protein